MNGWKGATAAGVTHRTIGPEVIGRAAAPAALLQRAVVMVVETIAAMIVAHFDRMDSLLTGSVG